MSPEPRRRPRRTFPMCATDRVVVGVLWAILLGVVKWLGGRIETKADASLAKLDQLAERVAHIEGRLENITAITPHADQPRLAGK